MGAPAHLALPADEEARTAEAVTAWHALNQEAMFWQAMQGLAKDLQTSIEDLGLCAWASVLSRLSTQTDVVLAISRDAAAGELNAWPLRFILQPGTTLAELLSQLQQQRLAAQAHLQLSQASLQAMLALGQGQDAECMSVGFSADFLQEAGDKVPSLQNYDLCLVVASSEHGPQACIHHQRSRFSSSYVSKLGSYWSNLLQALAIMPAAALESLPILDQEQSREALDFGNDSGASWPPLPYVHALFEQQAERTPADIALVQDGQRLSYAQLNTAANQLAHHLRHLGVGCDDRVAIYLDRGIGMIVSLLAVLKAGAAYVPLDPTYPAERLAYTVQDSAPKVLLSQSGMENDWRQVLGELPADIVVLDVEADAEQWQSLPGANPHADQTGLSARNLAYVLYTSGSTGKPKGVAMPHGPLINLIQWQIRQAGSEHAQRTLQFAALGFDVAFQETFATLCTGGELHLIDQDTRLSAGKLFGFIVEHQIERLFLPYFALQMLAEGMDQYQPMASAPRLECVLREIITAGEQLRIEPKIVRLFEQLPGCRLHNHYGPTESHVVTALTLQGLPAQWQRLPSIGAPISNARVYVLDAYCQPLPRGVVGELYLAGPVLARGYLQRDDLSAEKFLSDPYESPHAEASPRMYRTGDLGRWLVDGTIEFLGRKDFQIKIRGFRVELGEIEAQMMAFPGVNEVGVLAREDSPGLKRLVAYYTSRDTAQPVQVEHLRQHLVANLPDYMVPVAFVEMPAMPLSPNGKLDRQRLPAPGRQRPDWVGVYESPRDATEIALCRILADVLDLESLGRLDNFFDLGGTSLLAVRVLEQIRRQGLGDVSTMALFREPTAAALAQTLHASRGTGIEAARLPRLQSRDQREQVLAEPIAIVSMAGRFPGANDVETFWQNLCEGRDSITHFGLDDLDPSVPENLRRDPAYVAARGIIEDVDKFDASFFGISPKEAELMDPQQRLFLELCWECMERAGHAPDSMNVPVGVFAGMYNGSYFQHNVSAHPGLIDKLGAFQVMLGNEKDYIATRVAHKLNFTGPAISVHTACSTSLVAISQAVDSLRAGHCDMALAGGIAVACPVRSGHLYQEGAMLSPDGKTRSFDTDAKGTVFSDGAAVLGLKRLSDAIADGNPVIALIRGAAVNNDGGSKASFTAPSSEGQAAVIAMAHANAGVEARSIGYVETHGTATPLGDPIEIEGLTKAFRLGTQDSGFCLVGSVKSNIGHTIIAAGATGTIKAALALSEGLIPGTAHFSCANPVIAFEQTPFHVSASNTIWNNASDSPLRAGVSSFGVGGTNAHVVLEQAPARLPSESVQGPQVLRLSARNPATLAQSAQRLAAHLQGNPQVNLADVAWTLAVGRKAFNHRLAIAARDVDEAVEQLRSTELASAISNSRAAHASDVVFMFPGQGCQYLGMGKTLYRQEAAFRNAFDACAVGLQAELGRDLREIVFGDDIEAMLPTAIMQPAIFSIEYALAQWWLDQGVRPAAMIGHSVGEFVAATLAGVFKLADVLRLVARRGALMQSMPAGAMLSVRLPWDTLQARLPAGLSLSGENAPAACVVGGSHEAVASFQLQLEGEGIACRLLRTSHAFHSAMMDPIVDPFRDEVASISLDPPSIPIMSTATGNWLAADEAVSADYWARHLRQPVQFSAALAGLLQQPENVLLEIGPRNTLSLLARQQPGLKNHRVIAIPSLGDSNQSEQRLLHAAAGHLWSAGIDVDASRFDRRTRRHRLRLPTYPFERQRHWVDAPAALHGNVVPLPSVVSRPILEHAMSAVSVATPAPLDRKPRLMAEIKEVFEDVAGFDLSDADREANFIELGLDSLMLTQVALQLQKTFPAKITFRQLMGEYASLSRLAQGLDEQLPAETAAPAQLAPTTNMPVASAAMVPVLTPSASQGVVASTAAPDYLRALIDQQMQLMSQQLALLAGTGGAALVQPAASTSVAASVPPATAARAPIRSNPPAPASTDATTSSEEDTAAHTRYDIKKAFGAIARIDSAGNTELDGHQRARLDALIQRYTARTPKSKQFTQQHRAHMADPRVVTGFKPLTKEIVYQIVIERSKGSHLWDIDGNEYVDALNGFGTSLFGWQPSFVMDAVRKQLDDGYEIGPQHPLAGEVSQLVCELTGHERAALCNTGSEAVLGAMRIARTVTGRNTIVLFSGSYHGINDEVIVRGTKKMRSVPAAPGILRNTAENVLVLDYGTPETLQIIRERAHELAAVLVEPVQSRRPDFQPVEFLKEVRKITAESGAALIFDEVITGFRSHPGGAQALFCIQADLATYGKVVGGGYPIGVMAGKREFMDALDGGHWQYGDDSVPTIGVTYFAGTFVRHPLTLAAAKASLQHMKEQGEAMQAALNQRTSAMAAEINAFCEEVGAPLQIKHFASLWRTHFDEDHPLQDLLFAMMRSRGIHILDNFPCFFTTAHSEADFQAIIKAYKEAVVELQEAQFLPRRLATSRTVMDADKPIIPGARLGRDPEGRPAWYVPDPQQAGQFLKVGA